MSSLVLYTEVDFGMMLGAAIQMANLSSCNVMPGNAKEEDVSYEVPVLIIGGGPAGLFTAYMLSRHGGRSTSAFQTALALLGEDADSQTLEICRQYGLDTNTIRHLGSPRKDAYWVNFLTTLNGERIGSLPYERMDADVLESTPEMIHNIPQPDFEKFISNQVLGDPNVEIRKGIGFVSCEQRGDEVVTVVEERASTQRCIIKSRHVIGCDGAKSQVRRSLGIEAEGEDGYETMMTIHFSANLRPVVKDRVGMLHWIVDPACPGFIIAYDLGGNQVLISNFSPKQQPIETWNEEVARAAVSAAIGKDIALKIISYRPWVLSQKVAKAYRRGSVFLVGDAAHSFPPTGGLGLNSGIADAHNLAYKIAAVHQGWAGPGLLDTYESERRPVAVVAAAQSVKNGKSIFSFLKAVGAAESEDLDEARRRMYQTIHDPAKQALISENVERQREHFDNLEIHIGYVYGDEKPPASASHFTPKFKAGARLPHAWIKFKDRFEELARQPIDTSYVDELSHDQVAARRFSILDLVTPGTFNLITGSRSAWSQNFHESANALGGAISIRLWSADEDFAFCNESHRRLYDIEGGLSQGKAILVRPDQHILASLAPGKSALELIDHVKRHLDKR